jgi:hypothetical protein
MDAAQSSRSSGSRPWKCLRVQSNFGLGAFRRRARSRSSCARHLNRLDVRPMRHSILGARFDANDEAAASANRTANVTFVPDPHAAIMLTSTTSLRLDSKPLRSRGRSPSSRVMGRRSARTVVYSRAALAKRIPSANPALRGDSKVRHRTLELPSARYSGPRHARSGPLGAWGGAVAEGDRRAARHASPDVEPGAANAGLSFREAVNEALFEMASQLLRDTRLPRAMTGICANATWRTLPGST